MACSYCGNKIPTYDDSHLNFACHKESVCAKCAEQEKLLPLISCHYYGCAFATFNGIGSPETSLGMHKAYAHNPNHPYRKWLITQRLARMDKASQVHKV